MPPPPPELQGAGPEATPEISAPLLLDGSEISPTGAKSLELVLERHSPMESEAMKGAARMQAGYDKVKLKIESLSQQDLPARQVDLVREALARGALALVVEPADPNDARMTEALQDAQAKGVPVVLLNRPLSSGRSALTSLPNRSAATAKNSAPPTPSEATASTPGSRLTPAIVLVAPASFIPSANQIVSSAMRNAKNAKLDPKGGAVILTHSTGDSFVEDRAAAIRSALKSNIINPVVEIRFSGDLEAGAKLLAESLRANPKPVMVFSVDSLTSAAARQALKEIVAERPFVLAGYAAEESYSEMAQYADFAAVAEFAPLRVVRKAITTAVALARGRVLPGRIEVPINVSDSPEDSGLSRSSTVRGAGAASPKSGP
jgi:ABC-type sugar transport system substrate-binding protein